MKPDSAPPRLVQDPELGPLLRQARAESFSDERAQAAAPGLHQRLASLPAPRPRALAWTIGAMSLAAAGAFAAWQMRESAPEIPPPVMTRPAAPPTPTPAPAPAPAPTSRASEPGTTPAVPLHREVPAPEVAPPPLSRLAPQLALLAAARQNAGNGEHERALTLLDDLERSYPDTPLAPEVEQERVTSLVAARSADEALAYVRRLIADPAHAPRRADLLLLEGQLQAGQGRCDEATSAFQRALGLGLSLEGQASARAGLVGCSGR